MNQDAQKRIDEISAALKATCSGYVGQSVTEESIPLIKDAVCQALAPIAKAHTDERMKKAVWTFMVNDKEPNILHVDVKL